MEDLLFGVSFLIVHMDVSSKHKVSSTDVSFDPWVPSMSCESNLKFQYFLVNISAFFWPLNFPIDSSCWP